MGFIKSFFIKTGVTARAKGQAMVEYGLILVLVSVVAIVGLTVVGGELYNSRLLTGAPTAGDVVALNTATGVPAHILGSVSGEPAGARGAPGAFNNIIFALSNGTRVV